MRSLRLLAGPAAGEAGGFGDLDEFLPPPARRPGVAYEVIRVTVGRQEVATLAQMAAPTGVQLEYWCALAAEAHRAEESAARALDRPLAAVRQSLDAAARTADQPQASFRYGRRLQAYARALTRSGLRVREHSKGELALPLPYHTALAWEHAAAASSRSLEAFAHHLLHDPPSAAHRWEAAAAAAGLLLGEWVALQAARRARAS